MNRKERQSHLRLHASHVFEEYCRSLHPGSSRYWEPGIEFDLVYETGKKLVVGEVKFARLEARERASIQSELKNRWQRCKLSKKYPVAEFKVFDEEMLES